MKKEIIKKDVFDREIALCKRLSKEGGGQCHWGECSKCGVIPLLYKLNKGQLLENPAKIAEIRAKILKLK